MMDLTQEHVLRVNENAGMFLLGLMGFVLLLVLWIVLKQYKEERKNES